MKRSRIFITVIVLVTMFSIGSSVMAGSGASADFQPAIADDAAALTLPSLGPSGPDNPRVPNAIGQFDKLAVHGDPLVLIYGSGIDKSLECKHYQGIVRVNSKFGVPHFLLGRSGNNSGFCHFPDDDDDPAELVIAVMQSKQTEGNWYGERLRSNRFAPGLDMEETAYADDAAAYHIHFDGNASIPGYPPWPPYMHPGGMQVIGDVLAMAIYDRCDGGFSVKDIPLVGPHSTCEDKSDQGAIILIDVSNPMTPKLIEEITMGDIRNAPAEPEHRKLRIGVVAVTKRLNGKYLFAVTGSSYNKGRTVWFLESTTEVLADDTVLEFVDAWHSHELPVESDWCGHCDTECGFPTLPNKPCRMEWQMLNFVRDSNDRLFLIGTDNETPLVHDDDLLGSSGWDRARMFEVHFLPQTDGKEEVRLTTVGKKNLWLEQPSMGDLDAAAGVYVSPSGQLILYTADHYGRSIGGATPHLVMGEFRNIDVRHDAALPDPLCGGWVELYSDPWGWDNEIDSSPDRSLMFDYLDQGKDDWHNLNDYDAGFGDDTSAFRWNLAYGQVAELCEHANFGGQCVTLRWDADRKNQPDLSGLFWENKISSVKIKPPPGMEPEICDGRDNNCNGKKDEGFGPDLDLDGWGGDCDECPHDPNKHAIGVCGCGLPDVDSDDDGALDCFDDCPNDPNKHDPGVCGCGVADTDSDDDGTADCLDLCPLDPAKIAPEVCGCGVADDDSDGDGTADCHDRCALDPDKIDPGACGCGVTDDDSDDDEMADCVDPCTDTDDDGLGNPGYPANTCATDNCPNTFNPDQADRDGDGIGNACELPPRPAKLVVLTDLSSLLPTGDKKTDGRIKKAIESVEDSLKDKYWADDSHLVEKGKKVFDEEKKAVKELMKVDEPDVSGTINSLVYDADEVLARLAIEEAVSAAMGCPTNIQGPEGSKGSKGPDCDKALKEIDKAHEEMDKAQEDLDKGDPDKAIDHYKKAWEHAQKAQDKLS